MKRLLFAVGSQDNLFPSDLPDFLSSHQPDIPISKPFSRCTLYCAFQLFFLLFLLLRVHFSILMMGRHKRYTMCVTIFNASLIKSQSKIECICLINELKCET